MVEASLDGGRYAAGPLSGDAQNRLRSHVEERVKREKTIKPGKKELSTDITYDESEIRKEEQQLTAKYQQVSLQLLDLCSTLHNLTPGILSQWAMTQPNVDASIPYVWSTIWRPLLQAMARLGCDCRRLVRAAALTHLQRAFLPSNMANLGPEEWESCFGDVLFPLLGKLVDVFSAMDPIGMEDTRVRAMQIVAKTLLNHLTALSTLPSFPSLWLRLLDFMDNYLRIDSCGNLNEAVPESLKNMLLVMASTGLFSSVPGLHQITVSRMRNVLPQLIRDTLPDLPSSVVSTQSEGPKSLTLIASAGRIGGSRVQIAPAIPSSSEESLPLLPPAATTNSPSMPITAVTSSIDVVHSDMILCTAPDVENIPDLTEVVVHSGPASPKTYSHGAELPLHTAATSLCSNISSGEMGVPQGVVFHTPSPYVQITPCVEPAIQQQYYHEVLAESSLSQQSQSQYYAPKCQQYPSYVTNYHPVTASYPHPQRHLQQQHACSPQASSSQALPNTVSQHLQQSSPHSTELSATNPLLLPSVPLIASPHSAFTQVTDTAQQRLCDAAHQQPHHQINTPPLQERP
ncbi:hypothetical protein DICVIV_04035 [Dictyocaulus viviparus]|uniref:GBF1-like tetratricopeptide repeats domain-containing protein n=1 Tax=Dictyocaulus viviparus TaxID=29172 RepID=A0A0D8Y5L5_DICVI|nr:hypothetical protein DICVIV_04035 [Dictyocaulus viviparus]